MTLKEFSKNCTANCTLPVGKVEYRPTNSFRQKYTYGTFFGKKYGATQQLWEGVHLGEVVATEWRDIEEYFDFVIE